MKKLSKIAGALDWILDPAFKFIMFTVGPLTSAVVFAFLLSCLGILDVNWDDWGNYFLQSIINFGGIIIELPKDYVIPKGVGTIYFVICILGLIIKSFILLIGIHIAQQIIKPMMKEEPFWKNAEINFKKLGYLTLIYGIIDEISDFSKNLFFQKYFDLPQLLANGDVVSIKTTPYIIDIDFILMVVIFFMLAYIFRYGEELQQLSDETL